MSGCNNKNSSNQNNATIVNNDTPDCNICGENHDSEDCLFLHGLHYVEDSPIISRARQSLPKDLEIIRMADGTETVVAKVEFQQGCTFGPFIASKAWTASPVSHFPIKVFGEKEEDTYYLDFSNEDRSNWMAFVTPASNAKEQNLVCFQMENKIYYSALRTIIPGEELKVWYTPHYARKMNVSLLNLEQQSADEIVESFVEDIPKSNLKFYWEENSQTLVNEEPETCFSKIIVKSEKDEAEDLVEKLPAQRLGARNEKATWNCKICSSVISSVVAYAKHLMEHYKPLLGVFCDICNRKFNNTSVLEKHKKSKHSQPNASLESNSNPFSLQSGPLDSDHRSLESSKIQNNLQLSLLDANLKSSMENSSDSMLVDYDTVKFYVEELSTGLLDIVGDVNNPSKGQENLECDICEKKFDKVNYLYRHLRKHTGEFMCKLCLMVFARKENLLTHSCLNQQKDYPYECSVCQKSFAVMKYLKRHMTVHTDTNTCKWCRLSFGSRFEYNSHKCLAPRHICLKCGKKFMHKKHLNRHEKVHNDSSKQSTVVKKKKQEVKLVICEKCGSVFKNTHTLKQHMRSHGERKYECDVCNRKFHRIGVLKEHKSMHESAQIPCAVCGKKLRSKKALDIHMLLHGNKKFQCDKCDKSFFQKCNFMKHYRQVHDQTVTYKCDFCPAEFTQKRSFDKHAESHAKSADYSCPHCLKLFQKKIQLQRHVKTSHSGLIYRCPFCQMTARHKHSMRRHFERLHNDKKNEWDKTDLINQIVEKTEIIIESPVGVDDTARAGKIVDAGDSQDDILASISKVNFLPLSGISCSEETNSLNGGVMLAMQKDDQMKHLSDQDLLLQVSGIDHQQTLGSNLSLESPQFMINATDIQLTEPVLENTYILNEDEMFYVLDQASVITEF